MAFNVNEFRAQLTLGGARNTQFQVQFNNPVNSAGDLKVPFMCKAAQLPSAQQGVIELPYFGRKIKEAGDRFYDPWIVTIINDEDFLIRNSLEEWSHELNSPEDNLRGFGSAGLNAYPVDATVTQFSKTGVPVRTYTFKNMWPGALSEIDLSWEAVDQIEEYQVTFHYDYWVPSGVTGSAGT